MKSEKKMYNSLNSAYVFLLSVYFFFFFFFLHLYSIKYAFRCLSDLFLSLGLCSCEDQSFYLVFVWNIEKIENTSFVYCIQKASFVR